MCMNISCVQHDDMLEKCEQSFVKNAYSSLHWPPNTSTLAVAVQELILCEVFITKGLLRCDYFFGLSIYHCSVIIRIIYHVKLVL